LQPDVLTVILEYVNTFFAIMFAVEMLFKIISDGLFDYIRSGFNVFDSVIVVLRLVAAQLSSFIQSVFY